MLTRLGIATKRALTVGELTVMNYGNITTDVIKNAVSEHYKIDTRMLRSRSVDGVVREARKVYVWLAVNLTGITTGELGKELDRYQSNTQRLLETTQNLIDTDDQLMCSTILKIMKTLSYESIEN